MKHKGFSIRWRKSSATFVVYEGRSVYESGFDSEKDAVDYIDDRLDRIANPPGRIAFKKFTWEK